MAKQWVWLVFMVVWVRGDVGVFQEDNGSLYWRSWREVVRLSPFGRDAIRVRFARTDHPTDPWPESPVSALLPPNISSFHQIHLENEHEAHLVNGLLELQVGPLEDMDDNADLKLKFIRSDTKDLLFEELWPLHGDRPRYLEAKTHSGLMCSAHWDLKPAANEQFYGLGQHQHGRLDQRGLVVDLDHYNSEVGIPFLLSSKKYGVIWNTAGTARVELAENRVRFSADAVLEMDLVVIAGRSYAQIMERLADITGHSPEMPYFATGYWQSKLRYSSQQEVDRVLKEFRQRQLPVSVLVIDFFHWTKFGEWKFDAKAFPDPARMVQTASDVHLAVSMWPFVQDDAETFEEMSSRGMLSHNEYGSPSIGQFAGSYLYEIDVFLPETRDFVFDRLRQGYLAYNISSFWLDSDEADLGERNPQVPGRSSRVFSSGPAAHVALAYPRFEQQMIFQGLQSLHRPTISLSRSAFLGSQRFATLLWSGDIRSSWESLRLQIPAGLNAQLSGIPWWTSDTGGFAGGRIESLDFQQLLMRWFEYSTFCPVLRMHGTRDCDDRQGFDSCPNEPWSYGPRVLQHLTAMIELRERMRPYIMQQMKKAARFGTPVQRPLWFDYEHDEIVFSLEPTSFLFGDDILVAPIVFPDQTTRDVYLPSNSSWIPCFSSSSASLPGGRWLHNFSAPLGEPAVFLRTSAPSDLIPSNPLLSHLCKNLSLSASF